jgi:flavin reductase (DIM6/NTAB) family NADH-FMN oxidoreductase RutF
MAFSAAQPFDDVLLRGVAHESFCDTFSSVPMPVSVVTTLNGEGRPHGTTVSAFCSLSADPPLVLVALDRESELLGHLTRSGRFGLNLLAAGQQQIGLACSQKGIGKFEGVGWYEDDGLPRIRDTAAWLACDVEQILPGGDHLIVTGLITRCEKASGSPLIYHRRRFHELPWSND